MANTFVIKYQAECDDCKVLFKDQRGKMVHIDNFSSASQLPDSLVVKTGFKAFIQVAGKPNNGSKVSAVIENRTGETRATVSKSENKNPHAKVEATWTAPYSLTQ